MTASGQSVTGCEQLQALLFPVHWDATADQVLQARPSLAATVPQPAPGVSPSSLSQRHLPLLSAWMSCSTLACSAVSSSVAASTGSLARSTGTPPADTVIAGACSSSIIRLS